MKASTFSNNYSSSEYGGAIYNASTMAVAAGSSFKGNSAPYGGAVYNASTFTLSGDSLSGNTAQYGAGLYTADFGPSARPHSSRTRRPRRGVVSTTTPATT